MVDTRLDRGVPAMCLDDATIAAFVDGMLDSEERDRRRRTSRLVPRLPGVGGGGRSHPRGTAEPGQRRHC